MFPLVVSFTFWPMDFSVKQHGHPCMSFELMACYVKGKTGCVTRWSDDARLSLPRHLTTAVPIHLCNRQACLASLRPGLHRASPTARPSQAAGSCRAQLQRCPPAACLASACVTSRRFSQYFRRVRYYSVCCGDLWSLMSLLRSCWQIVSRTVAEGDLRKCVLGSHCRPISHPCLGLRHNSVEMRPFRERRSRMSLTSNRKLDTIKLHEEVPSEAKTGLSWGLLPQTAKSWV